MTGEFLEREQREPNGGELREEARAAGL